MKQLDFELLGSKVVLEVFAKDKDNLKSKLTNVTINIGNINDNVPKISMDFPTIDLNEGNCSFEKIQDPDLKVFYTEIIEIPENSAFRSESLNHSQFFNLTVTDLDTDPNNFVFCEVSDGSDQNIRLKQISENQYQICFSCDFFDDPVFFPSLFDYESASCHFIDISCTDNDIPSFTSKARLLIKLIDLNDNAPVFEYPIYPFTIHTPNLCRSFEVGRVWARDRDHDIYSKLGYTIKTCAGLQTSGGRSRNDLSVLKRHIKVSSTRGMVTMDLRDSTDCRQFRSVLFRCEIIARNVEAPFYESSTVAYIFIEQTYKMESYKNKHMFIFENQPILSFVGNLKTIMKTHQNFTFSILEGATRDLKMLSKTGDIVSQVYLDREIRDAYKFVFRADQRAPTQSRTYRTLRVIVHVLDINDKAPEFVIPRNGEVVKVYHESVYARRRVCDVLAKDLDVGNNSAIKYSLLNNE